MKINGFGRWMTAGAVAATLGGALSASEAVAAPLPVIGANTVANAPQAEQVRYRGGYGRRGFYGGFGAGAALGLVGAATFGGFGPYYGGYGYGYGGYPYGYGYGYSVAYGYGYPYGYRRAYGPRSGYYGGIRRAGFYGPGYGYYGRRW